MNIYNYFYDIINNDIFIHNIFHNISHLKIYIFVHNISHNIS